VGAGCFLGFFASLVLRCCPLAMLVLLGDENTMKATTKYNRVAQVLLPSARPGCSQARRANDNPLPEKVLNIFGLPARAFPK